MDINRIIELTNKPKNASFDNRCYKSTHTKQRRAKIIDTISGKTIGRVLKKRVKASPAAMLGYPPAAKR